MKTDPASSCSPDGLFRGVVEDSVMLNAQILRELEAARPYWQHSHWVKGRWENTYVSFAQVPSARQLLGQLTELLSVCWGRQLRLLHDPCEPERSSFWFNIAAPRAETGMHRHSERASVSAVYYLQADEHAGVLYFQETQEQIVPKSGHWVSFLPERVHAVASNVSERERISLAVNFYE